MSIKNMRGLSENMVIEICWLYSRGTPHISVDSINKNTLNALLYRGIFTVDSKKQKYYLTSFGRAIAKALEY